MISNEVTLSNSCEKVLSCGRYYQGNISNNQQKVQPISVVLRLSIVIFRSTNPEQDEYFISVTSEPVL